MPPVSMVATSCRAGKCENGEHASAEPQPRHPQRIGINAIDQRRLDRTPFNLEAMPRIDPDRRFIIRENARLQSRQPAPIAGDIEKRGEGMLLDAPGVKLAEGA